MKYREKTKWRYIWG